MPGLRPGGDLVGDRTIGRESPDVLDHRLVEPAGAAVPLAVGARIVGDLVVLGQVLLGDAQQALDQESERSGAVGAAVAVEIDDLVLLQPADDRADRGLVDVGGLAFGDLRNRILHRLKMKIVPQLDVDVLDGVVGRPRVLLRAAALVARGQAPQVQVDVHAEVVQEDLLRGRVVLDVVHPGAAVKPPVPDGPAVGGLPAAQVAHVLRNAVDHPHGPLRDHAGLAEDASVGGHDRIEVTLARNQVVDRRRRGVDLDLLVAREVRGRGHPYGGGFPLPGELHGIGLVRAGVVGHIGLVVVRIVGVVHLFQVCPDAGVHDVVLGFLLVVHPGGVQLRRTELVAVQGNGVRGADASLDFIAFQDEGVALLQGGGKRDQVIPLARLEGLPVGSREPHLGSGLRDIRHERSPGLVEADGNPAGERLAPV